MSEVAVTHRRPRPAGGVPRARGGAPRAWRRRRRGAAARGARRARRPRRSRAASRRRFMRLDAALRPRGGDSRRFDAAPIFGTCAGMIVLDREHLDARRPRGRSKRVRPPGAELRGGRRAGRRRDPAARCVHPGAARRGPATVSRCSASSTASPSSCATGASCSRPSTPSSRTTCASTSSSWRWSRRRAMSGHSKWALDQAQEGRGRREARPALLEALARDHRRSAKEGGGDPAGNLALQNAIEKARSYSMPKDNIERAIAKGAGADADAASFETVIYEGYGPEGVAVLVEALTDNRNRTASEVRHAFTKHGGNLGDDRRRRVAVRAARGRPRRRGRRRRGRAHAGRGRRGRRRRRARRIELRRHERAGDRCRRARRRSRPPASRSSRSSSRWCRRRRSPSTTSGRAQDHALVDGLEETDDVQDVYANFDIPESVLEAVAS